jgi:hypothetical protein
LLSGQCERDDFLHSTLTFSIESRQATLLFDPFAATVLIGIDGSQLFG